MCILRHGDCRTDADTVHELQGALPVYHPDRGACMCCGKPLGDPIYRPGGPVVSGTAFVAGQAVHVSGGGGRFEYSCPHCGDPQPKIYSAWTSWGRLLIGLQSLLAGFGICVWLISTEGPWKLTAGKAFLAGVASFIALVVLGSLARTRMWLALPLFLLFAFWPTIVPAPTEIPADLVPGMRLKVLAAALPLNLIAFAMLLKTRRKPFGNY